MSEQMQAMQAKPATRAQRVKWLFVRCLLRAYDVPRFLFLRFVYRHLMRLTHYFGWHYAPIRGPFPGGSYHRWCQWCGMRGDVYIDGPLKRCDGDSHDSR